MPHVWPRLLGATARLVGLGLSGSTTKFLRADGSEATPSSSPGSTDLAGFLGRQWWHETNVTATGFQQTNVLINFTGVGTTAADIANDGLWLRHTTAAATTGTSTHQQAITSNQVRRRWKAIHVMYMKTYTDITNVRFWFGLFSAAPQATDDLASGHLAAFRYSTAVDGTAFWRTCTKDGSTQEEQTTTVAVATDTAYLFRIELDITEVRFYIDGTLATTHSTNLPGIDSPNLGQHVGCTNLNNSNHSFLYGRQWGLLQI